MCFSKGRGHLHPKCLPRRAGEAGEEADGWEAKGPSIGGEQQDQQLGVVFQVIFGVSGDFCYFKLWINHLGMIFGDL